MRKIGVAVIGIGFWGKNHVRVFSELHETELIAVCDINESKIEAIKEKYGVKGYTDSKELLKRKDIHAVSICTWTTTHAEEALKALNAGKHILVEKPLASTVPQAKKIIALARRKNLYLMSGFIERFNPGVMRVKKEIENERIGTPVSVTARRVSEWPERIGDIGVVKDTAIHDIDILRYIFNEEPNMIYAKAGNLRHKKYEDYAQIMLTFKDEKTAFIEANWLTPYRVRELIITGSQGIINLNYLTQQITIDTAGQTIIPRYKWEEPLKKELQHFAISIIENKQPLVTGIDGLKALIIAEAALKSAKENKTINVTDALAHDP
jgi:UDP-N-acetylglucosamine 3-dehydrogenase